MTMAILLSPARTQAEGRAQQVNRTKNQEPRTTLARNTNQGTQTLLVTLHDTTGMPITGAQVIIRTADGLHVLAQAPTDDSGSVRFTELPEQVRVGVSGSLPNGVALYQRGLDAQGIAIWLDGTEALLALRSEADGEVVPDLGMITEDTPIDVVTSVPDVAASATAAPTSVVQQATATPVQPTHTPLAQPIPSHGLPSCSSFQQACCLSWPFGGSCDEQSLRNQQGTLGSALGNRPSAHCKPAS
jgi:hypothetical protein